MLLILFFLSFIIILFLISEINVEITYVFSNVIKKNNKILNRLEIIYKIYLIKKIKIFEKKLIRENKKEEKKSNDTFFLNKKNILELIKNLKFKNKKLKLSLKLGTDDIQLTNFLIVSLIFFLTAVLRKLKVESPEYMVQPIYNNGNKVDLRINTIFRAKILHILYALYLLKIKKKKERKIVYGRVKPNTSD